MSRSVKAVPMGRLGTGEEVAKAIAFMAFARLVRS